MRTCLRLDDRVCSGWFAEDRGIRQEYMLAPLLFNVLFAAVINGAYTRFKADKASMHALVQLRKKPGARGRQVVTSEEPVLEASLESMLYTDETRVVPQPPEQLRKMVGVIVVVCAAVGLTVTEAKTEIVCLRTNGIPESTAMFSVKAAGQVYNQTNEFLYLGENVNPSDLSIEVN